MAKLGVFLRTLRKNKGLTLREVSDRSGISHPYLSQLETGKNENPSKEVLRKLSEVYNYSYGDLLQMAGYLDDMQKASDKLSQAMESITNLYPLLVLGQGINVPLKYRDVELNEIDIHRAIAVLDAVFYDRIKVWE